MHFAKWSLIFFCLMADLAVSGFLPMGVPATEPTASSPISILADWKTMPESRMQVLDADARPGDDGWLSLNAKTKSGRCGISIVASEKPWNLEGFAQIAVPVRNLGHEPVRVMLFADDGRNGPQTEYSHASYVKIQPGKDIFWLSVELGDRAFKKKWILLDGTPPGLVPGNINESKVTGVKLFMLESGGDERKITIGPIVARGTALHLKDIGAMLPFIDAFGQYKHKEWPDKIHREADFAQRLATEKADLASHARPAGWDKYGGWLEGPQLKATGFFRVEKRDGKWWMVDPDGRLFWSHGSVRVGTRYRLGNIYHGTPIQEREAYFELPPRNGPLGQFYDTEVRAPRGYYADKEGHAVYDYLEANLYRKYGSDWTKQYGEMAQRRLASWGLNTIANSSDPKIFGLRRTPYTAIVYSIPLGRADHTIAGAHQGWVKFPDPFDPGFRQGIDRTLRTTLKDALNDPWCLGFFVDNEMSFGDGCSLAEAALASPPEQQAKQALIDDLKKKYASIDKLNAAWNTRHADWNALLADTDKPDRKRSAVRADLEAFNERILEGYFRSCREALEAAAPGHMYLGCRFAGSNPMVLRVAGKYCDIMSFNAYRRDFEGYDPAPGIDRPIVSGEFYFTALDRGKFTHFIAVIDQTERADAYCRYVRSALRHPKMVGTHWFQFYDEPTTGRFDGENLQTGLLDICDTPYWETIDACRRMGASMYAIRSGKQQ